MTRRDKKKHREDEEAESEEGKAIVVCAGLDITVDSKGPWPKWLMGISVRRILVKKLLSLLVVVVVVVVVGW